jgi:uncharacterized damage-inducible protein DinB
MIDPDYVRLMARYNAEMNARWLAAASRLDDDARRADRGAFFGSIHGTFNHLLWADRVWLWRLAGAEEPTHPREQSASFVDDFEELSRFVARTDREIVEWAETVTRTSSPPRSPGSPARRASSLLPRRCGWCTCSTTRPTIAARSMRF